MGTEATGLVDDEGVKILPHKEEEQEKPETHEQFKVVWPKDLTADIRRLADLSGRSIKDASEKLMRWAVNRAMSEYEAAGELDNTDSNSKRGKS